MIGLQQHGLKYKKAILFVGRKAEKVAALFIGNLLDPYYASIRDRIVAICT